ncbi:hypothetical protein GCM10010102_43600 [Promicromonospora citrea]|uniref:Uncharacterized protein n=1 Tax=Promicromonospora citrea TaxID=43677 RepID=A0A8H9L6I9_9MICO|nr:hypothetical protein GCM10010102_43600 [Promicromonospora citrea]
MTFRSLGAEDATAVAEALAGSRSHVDQASGSPARIQLGLAQRAAILRLERLAGGG